MDYSSKIYRLGRTLPIFENCKIVFTNGCFDLLHPGHLSYLHSARELGDVLLVAMNSDNSVRRLKGANRPINDFEFRATMLSYFEFIDAIIEFDDETPFDLIQKFEPKVLVKGSDYKEEDVVGGNFVKMNGGEVVLIDYIVGFSSTTILNRIEISNRLI